jgi:AmmeMemoRadiSam system protein B
MPVDAKAIRAMVEAARVVIDDEPHAPDHAIEVELPFLQAIFGNLPIVPLLATSKAYVGYGAWAIG